VKGITTRSPAKDQIKNDASETSMHSTTSITMTHEIETIKIWKSFCILDHVVIFSPRKITAEESFCAEN
jgi:hypothetical protein